MLAIFDLDDTLLDTSDLYWRVREEFLSLLKVPGITRNKLRGIFEEEDSISIQETGFHPDRYGITMLRIYDRMVSEGKISHADDVRRQVKEIAKKISVQVPLQIDGSIETLTELKQSGIPLALLTRGIEKVQLNKIRHYHLQDFFGKNIFVVDRKNPEIFLNALKTLNQKPKETWIIGDSLKSDINPGIEIGAHCIQYLYTHKHYNWIQEHNEEPISSGYLTVKSLKEIPPIIYNSMRRPPVQNKRRKAAQKSKI